MAGIRDYIVDIYKLTDGRHDYHFVFKDSFFELFENSLIKKGNGDVDVTLDKSPTFIKLNFTIKGSVELFCDRSNDPFEFPVMSNQEIILKYGDSETELSDTISIIPWETQRIELAQYIYEFIGLSIPMKKLHPRYQDFADDADSIVFKTDPGIDDKEESKPDPRWSELEKLKNLKE